MSLGSASLREEYCSRIDLKRPRTISPRSVKMIDWRCCKREACCGVVLTGRPIDFRSRGGWLEQLAQAQVLFARPLRLATPLDFRDVEGCCRARIAG